MKFERAHWSLRLLRRFCPEQILEEIEGDLEERFEQDVRRFGERKARKRLHWNAIRFFRTEILLKGNSSTVSMAPMLFNNLRFSARHLFGHPLNSTIHIIGLTLGISTCLTIGLLLLHELTHDGYQRNADRIYRVNSAFPAQDFSIYATPIPLAEEIRRHTLGAKHVALVLPQFKSTVWINPEKIFSQEKALIAEPGFLDIFNFEPIAGDLNAALARPYTALLSESTAHKFFDNENPLGKSFKFRSEFNITVGGVYKDLPANTNLPASLILSYVDNEKYLNNGDTWYFGHIPWTKLQASTFVLLDDGVDANGFQQQLDRIADRNINSSPEIDKDVRGQLLLQSLSRVHLQPEFRGSPWVSAIRPSWLWFFGCIGMVVLALACINFLNLSTAQSITRSREVGVRKAIGAKKLQLINQFLCETFLLVIVSWLLAIIIVSAGLPTINNLIGNRISFPWSTDLALVIAASVIMVTALAGIYPAWIISRFKPAITLRGGGQATPGGSWLRKSLVVVQLGVSIVLLVVVVVITKQVDFVKSADLGVVRENVLSVEIPDRQRARAIAGELMAVHGIKAVSLSRTQPVSDDHWWNGVSATEDSPTVAACAIHADRQYFDVYGLKLISGNIPAEVTDTAQLKVNKVVVNEYLLEVLGLGSPDEAIGKRFQWAGETEIFGVIADFNTEPLRYALSPTLIVQDAREYSKACIRLEPGANLEAVTHSIESVWRKSFPDDVFNLQFLDEQVRNFYGTEDRLNQVFRIFAFIAIFISCLGLLGLAAFDTLRRRKEISIRKVMGAGTIQILTLLSNQFARLMLVSSLIAVPLSWYGVNRLLDSFAYKVPMALSFYAVPVLSLSLIAMLTISSLTIRAALTNPAENLKSE